MIAGHLQIKNDYYYMVLSYLDANGKRKQPWFCLLYTSDAADE